MSKDVHDLLPITSFNFFPDAIIVSELDRSEFLRRALLAVIFKFNWELVELVSIVKDRDTFEKIAITIIEMKGGHSVLKQIYNRLPITIPNFYLDILKNLRANS
jgi:hypothetical protein